MSENTESLIEKTLNSSDLRQCSENWQKCELEDILIYALDEQTTFKELNTEENEELINFENLILHPFYATEENRRKYLKKLLLGFTSSKLKPKREALSNYLPKKVRNEFIAISVPVSIGTFVAVNLAGAPTVAPFIGLGAVVLSGCLTYLKNRKKVVQERESDGQIMVRNFQLHNYLKKEFDINDFFTKNKDYLIERIDNYRTQYDDVIDQHKRELKNK